MLNKTLILTGAAGNLGLVVTQRLLADGYTLEATLSPHDDRAFYQHPELHTQLLDLLDEQAAANYVEALKEQHANLFGAVLLAGGFTAGDLEHTSSAGLERMFRLNFQTAFNIVRPLLQIIANQPGDGRIILIGSRPAIQPEEGKNLVAYSLSKSLLFRLAEYINADTASHGVIASVVVPGTMDTPANRAAMPGTNPALWVPTEKVAETISFLLSDTGGMLREPVVKIYHQA